MFNPEPVQPNAQIESHEIFFQKVLDEAETINIDPSVNRNQNGELLAEDGMTVSHIQNELYWKIIRTPSFKEWFRNSIVRDENGEPKVVYRSSLLKNFNVENPFQPKAQSWDKKHFGTFFTSSRESSIRWIESESFDIVAEDPNFEKYDGQVKVFSAFIKLENPYIETGYLPSRLDGTHTPNIADFSARFYQSGKEFQDLLQDHDGLYLPTSSDFGDEYAVLETKNIFILPSDTSLKKVVRPEAISNKGSPLRPKNSLVGRIIKRYFKRKA